MYNDVYIYNIMQFSFWSILEAYFRDLSSDVNSICEYVTATDIYNHQQKYLLHVGIYVYKTTLK